MGVLERREREKTELREKILDAARELFISDGYEGVSMRKVAEKIEYSPTAIYVYFADKAELFHQLCQEDFAKLAAVFQRDAQLADPLERLKQIGRTYANFGRQYPNHYKLMFMTPHPEPEFDERDREIKGNPESDAYAFLMQTMQEAITGGYLRPELTDADLVSQTLWAAIHGAISLQIAKCNDSAWVDWRPLEMRIETMLDVTLRGIRREGR
jgi:AcrR family transcriptional regulator